MNTGVKQQKESYEDIYSNANSWTYCDNGDALTKYLLERRLSIGVKRLMQNAHASPRDWDVLVVCGGVGGEGSILANMGFRSVTVSDISENALKACNARDPRLLTKVMNAESLDIPDESYDLVVVQDGLHHLPRPALGLTEMIRVSKEAVMMIEPHAGMVAKTLGREWEYHGDFVNYVFRWNKTFFEQVIRSYILQSPCRIIPIRLWSHNLVMDKLGRRCGGGQRGKRFVSLCYFLLDSFIGWMGNMMIGVLIKHPGK